jgi:hypothetical protein
LCVQRNKIFFFAFIFFSPSIVNAGTRPTSTHPSYSIEHSGVTSFLKDELRAGHLNDLAKLPVGAATAQRRKNEMTEYVCSTHRASRLFDVNSLHHQDTTLPQGNYRVA